MRRHCRDLSTKSAKFVLVPKKELSFVVIIIIIFISITMMAIIRTFVHRAVVQRKAMNYFALIAFVCLCAA